MSERAIDCKNDYHHLIVQVIKVGIVRWLFTGTVTKQKQCMACEYKGPIYYQVPIY